MKLIQKANAVSLLAILLDLVGVLLEVVGALVLTPAVNIGINLDLNPVTYVGVALCVVGLVAAILGRLLVKKLRSNEVLAIATLQVAILVFLFAVIFLALVILWPVICPANG
jgi:hypothetical protein